MSQTLQKVKRMLSLNSLRAQQQAQQQQPPLPQNNIVTQAKTQPQIQYDPRSGPIMSPQDLEAAVTGQGPSPVLHPVNSPSQAKQESPQSLPPPPRSQQHQNPPVPAQAQQNPPNSNAHLRNVSVDLFGVKK